MRGRYAVTFPATFSVTRVDGRGQPRAAPAVRQPIPLAAARRRAHRVDRTAAGGVRCDSCFQVDGRVLRMCPGLPSRSTFQV